VRFVPSHYQALPRGAVIAIARIVDCLPASELVAAGLSTRQQTFGDYGPGRWAWQLAEGQTPVELPRPHIRVSPGVASADAQVLSDLLRANKR
jgi:hypothetical protein